MFHTEITLEPWRRETPMSKIQTLPSLRPPARLHLPAIGAGILDRALPWLLPVGLFLLWWLAARHHWMSEQILPAPALVWQSALEFGSGELWGHLWISLQRLGIGLLAGVAGGVLLGAWLGLSRRAEALVYPSFVALAQIPTLAWIPLFMLFFGIGETLKLVVLVKAVVVPVTLHTLVGVRDAQPRLREAAAVLRLPPHLLAWRLVLPAALPAFMAGLRLALATGWTSLLAVELLASSEGIGYLMVWGRQLFMLDLVFVCILVIGLVGALMDRGINLLDARLLFWPHPATAERPRGPRLHGWQRLQAALLPLALLALWQASSARGWVDANILASPLDVLRALHQGLLDGSLPTAMGASLKRTVAGLALGGGAGLALGLLLGLSNRAERIAGPSLSALRQVAIFAWVPLLTAWFGLGEAAKLAFVALAAFFPLFIATQRGVAGLSPQLGEAARVMRLGLGKRLRLLVLPGAAPAIFAGLRLALIYAWLGTIGAEYFMPSDGGIASYMLGAQQLFRMDQVMAAMVLVGLVGALLGNLGQRIEARATRWRTA
nr:ABC transporter permease subunit [Pseudomonas tohonis]